MKILTDNTINLNEKNKSEFLELLLGSRGINSKKDQNEFLNPDISKLTLDNVGLNNKQINKSLIRIRQAIKNNEKIAIFGDYDVDGITGTAILFEILYAIYKNVTAYIPHRTEEGYGLSNTGIDNLLNLHPDTKLIITVDNGIVANQAVDYANGKNIDVIITDHHIEQDQESKSPNAYSIVHTTKLCGAGIAYMLSLSIAETLKIKNFDHASHLELAALGTIADMVELRSNNRIIAYHGIKHMRNTNRVGLLAIIKYSGITKEDIGVYEIGNIIAPRLNATGRMHSAMDSLRLICTNNETRADELAYKLEQTNRLRQVEMRSGADSAVQTIEKIDIKDKKILIISNPEYKQGVIGLIASRLVEKYYLPSIVMSEGEKTSKGSVRSIAGFNIIEYLRKHEKHFINLGGHPMAAGFTIETTKIEEIKNLLEENIDKLISDEMLQKTINIDCFIDINLIDIEFYKKIQELSPFGIGNPQPIFMSEVIVDSVKIIGKTQDHLKLTVSTETNKENKIEALGFNMGSNINNIYLKKPMKIVYSIDLNTWKERSTLQLYLKTILPQ